MAHSLLTDVNNLLAYALTVSQQTRFQSGLWWVMQTKLPTCPECKGEKEYKVLISEYWEEGPPQYEKRKCGECGGTGNVTSLRLAIYKARGGSAPNVMRRFA